MSLSIAYVVSVSLYCIVITAIVFDLMFQRDLTDFEYAPLCEPFNRLFEVQHIGTVCTNCMYKLYVQGKISIILC